MSIVQIKRGSQAQIELAKTANELNEGEPYLVTDKKRISVGLSTNSYSEVAKKNEVGDYALSFSYTDGQLSASDVTGYNFGIVDGEFSLTGGNLTTSVSAQSTIELVTPIALGGNRVVCFENGSLTYANPSSTSVVLGFTQGAVNAGETVTIHNSGELNGFFGLTVGSPIYLADNGTITQTVPTTGRLQYLGFAVTSTKIFITLNPALYLATPLPTLKYFIATYPFQSEPDYFNGVKTSLSLRSYLVGVQKQYFWHQMETSYGVYDFSEIISNLNELQAIGKKLIVYPNAESFSGNAIYVPSYLTTDPIYQGGVYPHPAVNPTGYNPCWYNTNVQNRFIAMMQALAAQIGTHPALEAIVLQETSTSRPDEAWWSVYLTNHMAGVKRVALETQLAFASRTVFQSINYPVEYLDGMIADFKTAGVGLASPDTRANDPNLINGAYAKIKAQNNQLKVLKQVDYINYESSTGGVEATPPTIASIDTFAKTFNPDYIVWLRRTAETSPPSNYFNDVITYLNSIH